MLWKKILGTSLICSLSQEQCPEAQLKIGAKKLLVISRAMEKYWTGNEVGNRGCRADGNVNKHSKFIMATPRNIEHSVRLFLASKINLHRAFVLAQLIQQRSWIDSIGIPQPCPRNISYRFRLCWFWFWSKLFWNQVFNNSLGEGSWESQNTWKLSS